jgi:hypothetical protein
LCGEESSVALMAARVSGAGREHDGDLTDARKAALSSSGCRRQRRAAAGGVLRGEQKG